MYFYKTLLSLIVLLPTFYANAMEKDNDAQSNIVGWISYRDAYKEMLWFEKYGGQKDLIQNRMQILYQDKSLKSVKPRLRLVGKTMNLALQLDDMNSTNLPLIKTAYDENAELILSTSSDQQISKVKFKSSISLHLRNDGVYQVADLLLACKQAQQFQNFINGPLSGKKVCKGIKILFSTTENNISIKVKTDQFKEKSLTSFEENSIFDGSTLKLKTVNFLFSEANEKSQIMIKSSPIAIIPMTE